MATLIPRENRPATEHHINEEKADDIIRTTAYHRRDFPLSVIWFSHRVHKDIRRSIATPFQRISNVGLGSLDRLPLELLLDTFSLLEVISLFKFRHINTRSRQTVDSLSQYQRAVSHGLNLFCALLRTRVAIDITILDFDKALCTKECTLCGQFGGFISILAWKRCCFKCLKKSPEFQVRSLASVRRNLNLTKAEVGQLRSFKSLPGLYSMKQYSQQSPIWMVSFHQVTSVYAKRQSPSLPHTESDWPNQKADCMGSCALPYYDKQTRKVERGISCAGCQLALEFVPIWGPQAELLCEARDKVYAQDSFLDHFRSCQQAQLL